MWEAALLQLVSDSLVWWWCEGCEGVEKVTVLVFLHLEAVMTMNSKIDLWKFHMWKTIY